MYKREREAEKKVNKKKVMKKMGIWICRSEIKKLNNHQKSGDLYRNIRGGIL
jgi:hypothetical protein